MGSAWVGYCCDGQMKDCSMKDCEYKDVIIMTSGFRHLFVDMEVEDGFYKLSLLLSCVAAVPGP